MTSFVISTGDLMKLSVSGLRKPFSLSLTHTSKYFSIVSLVQCSSVSVLRLSNSFISLWPVVDLSSKLHKVPFRSKILRFCDSISILHTSAVFIYYQHMDVEAILDSFSVSFPSLLIFQEHVAWKKNHRIYMVKNRIDGFYSLIHSQVIAYYMPSTALDTRDSNKTWFQFTPPEGSQWSRRRQTYKQV